MVRLLSLWQGRRRQDHLSAVGHRHGNARSRTVRTLAKEIEHPIPDLARVTWTRHRHRSDRQQAPDPQGSEWAVRYESDERPCGSGSDASSDGTGRFHKLVRRSVSKPVIRRQRLLSTDAQQSWQIDFQLSRASRLRGDGAQSTEVPFRVNQDSPLRSSVMRSLISETNGRVVDRRAGARSFCRLRSLRRNSRSAQAAVDVTPTMFPVLVNGGTWSRIQPPRPHRSCMPEPSSR